MALKTRPIRPGTPLPLSGRGTTLNLDSGARDRLRWASHVAKRLLKTDAGSSVLVRRAITLYAAHLETLLMSDTPAKLTQERRLLETAARGQQAAIADELLIAVPLRLFSDIAADAHEAAQAAAKASIQRELAADLARWGDQTRSSEAAEHE